MHYYLASMCISGSRLIKCNRSTNGNGINQLTKRVAYVWLKNVLFELYGVSKLFKNGRYSITILHNPKFMLMFKDFYKGSCEVLQMFQCLSLK